MVGIQSDIINIIKKDNWNCNNIVDENKKVKEKVIIQKIKGLKQKTDLCFINTKYPVWSIFKSIDFDVVILETNKNFEQMNSILTSNNFLYFENIYFHRNFLIS